MSRRTSLSVGVHRALSGVAITTTALMVPALSQAQAQQDQQTPSDLEQIVVTGSRIATNANLVSASPVTQIKAEEFQYRGITRVEDLINTLPQVTPEFSSTTVNGATGTATLDLRGLESSRTLTLVNGHRMGFGDPFVLAPDVNQIPGSLVERVEILTGGASSTYGSDAIAGVVNFIMKDDFEGFQLDYQYAGYQHSQGDGNVQQAVADSGFAQAPDDVTDGGTTNVTVTMGVNTDDGRGNITAYMGYRDIHAILQSQRDFSACALDAASSDYACAGSSTNAEGRFTDFGVMLPILAPDEDPTGLGAPNFDFHVANGDQFVPGVPLYNYGPLNYFQRPDERFVGGLFGHYEVDEHLDAYAEFMFMDDHSVAQIAPSGAFFVTSSINCANPLLSAQQHAAICGNDRVIDDEDVPGFDPATDKFVPGIDPRSVGIQSCDSRPDLPCPLYIGRRSIEGGARQSDLRHTSFRLLVGARGDLSDNWSYDVYANFSRLVFRQVYLNDMSTARIQKSLDVVPDPVTGEAVCRSTLLGLDPNCVPWNVFQEGGVTQEALDYLVLPLFANADLNADRAVGFVNGDLSDLGLVTPWSSEGVKVVLGGTYGHESMDFNPDIGFQTGDGAGQGGPTAAVAGVRNVKELFTEFRIPIADDLPWAESLALNLRYRYSDYSTGSTTDTYNIGGAWSPVETVKFRGGFSRAVRAPSIRELFAPQSLGLWGGTDPCAGPTPTLTEAQCELTGMTSSQYGNANLASPAGQYNQIAGGNPDLIPETADTVTVGAVFTPDELVPGLTFSIDYWNIKVEDAIDTIDPEFLINACGTSGDPTLCGLIQRGANGNLWVGTNAFVTSTNVNIGFFEVTGYDLTVNYGLEMGSMGGLDMSFRGTWLDQFDQQPVPGADIDDCAGVFGGSCNRPRPQWKHTFNAVWTTPWDTAITGSWRYVGEISEFDTDRFTADAENYIDLSATYSADWFGEGTTLTAGISNVFDNDPPVSGLFGNVGTFGNGNTIPGVWDSLGRYYFVGFTQNF